MNRPPGFFCKSAKHLLHCLQTGDFSLENALSPDDLPSCGCKGLPQSIDKGIDIINAMLTTFLTAAPLLAPDMVLYAYTLLLQTLSDFGRNSAANNYWSPYLQALGVWDGGDTGNCDWQSNLAPGNWDLTAPDGLYSPLSADCDELTQKTYDVLVGQQGAAKNDPLKCFSGPTEGLQPRTSDQFQCSLSACEKGPLRFSYACDVRNSFHSLGDNNNLEDDGLDDDDYDNLEHAKAAYESIGGHASPAFFEPASDEWEERELSASAHASPAFDASAEELKISSPVLFDSIADGPLPTRDGREPFLLHKDIDAQLKDFKSQEYANTSSDCHASPVFCVKDFTSQEKSTTAFLDACHASRVFF